MEETEVAEATEVEAESPGTPPAAPPQLIMLGGGDAEVCTGDGCS